jgi:3-hydroxybutyryl-CoA dehydrogenase
MHIVLLANSKTIEAFSNSYPNLNITASHTWEDLKTNHADAIFNLLDDAPLKDYTTITIPVFINSVSKTLSEFNHPKNVVRINGWNGFFENKTWELSGLISEKHLVVIEALNKKFIVLPDEPGFVAPRVIAMIINEAYFAKDEGVSTELEIDMAMKLGTNYPKGPFEWKNEIGITNIFSLLSVLKIKDKRYQPSSLLVKEAIQS